MHDFAPTPWTCDECGHVNSPESPVCRCYFWEDEPTREHDNWEERHGIPGVDYPIFPNGDTVYCEQCGEPITDLDYVDNYGLFHTSCAKEGAE